MDYFLCICFQTCNPPIPGDCGIRLPTHLVPRAGTPSTTGEMFSGVVSWFKWIFSTPNFSVRFCLIQSYDNNLALGHGTLTFPHIYCYFHYSNSQGKTYLHSNFGYSGSDSQVCIEKCEKFKPSILKPIVSEMLSTISEAPPTVSKMFLTLENKNILPVVTMLKPKDFRLIIRHLTLALG